jgi:hypothetical protein
MAAALIETQSVPDLEAVSAAYRRRMLVAELAGKVPTAVFLEAEVQRHEEALALWQHELERVLGASATDVSRVRFSQHTDGRKAGQGLLVFRPAPRLTLTLPGGATSSARTIEVCITGQTGLCARAASSAGTSLAFAWRGKVGDQPLGKEDLRAFLDYVVLTATEPASRRAGHRSALFFRSKTDAGAHVVDFAPLDFERATDYLAGLCGELLAFSPDSPGSGLHPYLLPHEAVLASHQRKTSLQQEIDSLRSNNERQDTGFSSLWGPVPDVLAHYRAPLEKEAQRMVDARFGLFFELATEPQP